MSSRVAAAVILAFFLGWLLTFSIRGDVVGIAAAVALIPAGILLNRFKLLRDQPRSLLSWAISVISFCVMCGIALEATSAMMDSENFRPLGAVEATGIVFLLIAAYLLVQKTWARRRA